MDSLDKLYLDWLYSQVGSVKDRNPRRTYWSLLGQLFTTQFVWFVPNDDNRAAAGQYLRNEFLADSGFKPADAGWMEAGCSVLEMMIALSRELAFEAYQGEPREWFWHMIDNLQIRFCDFEWTRKTEEFVNDVLNRFIFRQYRSDGRGGLFPLNSPQRDQREVEIWYQLNAYLLERE